MTGENMELKNLIEGFRLSCQTEGKSPKTVEWYTSFLLRFAGFLQSNSMPTQLAAIDKSHIRAFIRHLQVEAKTPHKNEPLSAATVQGYVRSLKAFFSWAEREGYTDGNIMQRIPVPKAPVKVVNTFTNEQLVRLLELCRSGNGKGYRNMAIVLLLLDSGIRVSECKEIELDDVNLENGCIMIRNGKGSKERIVPVGSLVQKTLWKYIKQFRPQPLTQQVKALFLSDKGLPLTRNGIQQMLRRYGRKAGINGIRCSPHTLRHTFAKNYLLNGGDIFSLQKMLGHSSLASVRLYVNLFATDIKKQHQRFSPVDNLIGNSQFCRLYRTT